MEPIAKLYDRKNYPERVINMFEIVAYYFVNHFYNHFYKIAKQKKIQGGNSITDEYKTLVAYYVKSFQCYGSHYNKILGGLNATYQKYTRYETFTVTDFTDRFLASFIPDEFLDEMDSRERDQFIIDILTSIITDFSKRVVEYDTLTKIIDTRNDPEHFRQLKSQLVDIQIMERERKFNALIGKIRSTDDSIPREVVAKMEGTIKALVRDKHMAIANLKKQKAVNMRLINFIKKIQAEAIKQGDVVNQIKANTPPVPTYIAPPPPQPVKRDAPPIDISSMYGGESRVTEIKPSYTTTVEDDDDEPEEKYQPRTVTFKEPVTDSNEDTYMNDIAKVAEVPSAPPITTDDILASLEDDDDD